MHYWRPDRLSFILYVIGVVLSVFVSPLIMLYREAHGELSRTPYQLGIFMPFAIAASLLLTLSAPILFVALRWWRRVASRTNSPRPYIRNTIAIVAGSLGLGVVLRVGWGGAGILFYLPTHPIAFDQYRRVLFGEPRILVFTSITAIVWAMPAAFYLLRHRGRSAPSALQTRVFDSAR